MNHCLERRIVFMAMIIFLQLTTGCAQKHYVQINDQSIALYLYNPNAKEVVFASSIDRFQLHSASKEKDNIWLVTVPRKSEFSYFYLVDKIPTFPDCQLTVLDDFGSKNCLFISEM